MLTEWPSLTQPPPVSTTVSTTSTPKPTLSRDEPVDREIESSVLCRNAKFSVLGLDWLPHDDQMLLDITDSNLRQRFILALLAFSFGELFMSNVDWLSI
jgi:hypothetical protein